MAGYMGFGMQSWLYKRRPRKPFTKRGSIPSFHPLHEYSREFKPKPKIKENTKVFKLLLTIALLGLFISICTWKNDFVEYSHKHRVSSKEAAIKVDEDAFTFLLDSGKKELRSSNFEMAYSELILAYNIRPDNEEVNQLLIETLSVLCSKKPSYCSKLDKVLNDSQ